MNTQRYYFQFLGLPLALLAFLFVAAPAARGVMLKSAELTAVVNEVKLVEHGKSERPAGVRDVVQGDSSVKTGIKSRAELLFQDKTLTRLGANTLFSFDQGTRDLELEHGTMLLQTPKGLGGAKIRTAAVTAAITGTTILLEYSPVAWTRRTPPGVSPLVAAMAPEQCVLELQHPARSYSTPDLAELRRKAALAKKGGAFVKVMVLEGTLRLYLNNRVGESVLIAAGHMVILSPNALSIPPGVEFDIARLAQTSLLVNNRFWGGSSAELNMALVSREITEQDKFKRTGDLSPTGLRILGGGTNVILGGNDVTTQIDRGQTALNTIQQPQNSPSSDPAPATASKPPVTFANVVQPDRGGGTPPLFALEGATAPTTDTPPPTSTTVAGNAKALAPSDPVVAGKRGSNFTLLSTAGPEGGVEGADLLSASRLVAKFAPLDADPAKKKFLSFDYRFLTNEIGESGNFGDRFDVEIKSGTDSILYRIERDTLQPGGTGTPTPLTLSNVGGFKGATDWLPLALDLTPFAGKDTTISLLVYDVGDPVVDTAVALGKVTVGNPPSSSAAGLPGKLSINLSSVTFGTAPGEMTPPHLEGLPPANGVGAAADVGSLVVTSPGAITLNAPLNASTGANGTGATLGGKGGTVSLSSTGGEVAINSTLKVSESATATGKASKVGGTIALTSEKTTGVAISVSNTGELLALVNAAATIGDGGKINLTSKGGGTIKINGKLDATSHGTITVENQGAAGLIELTGAQLAAAVVKVRAMGNDGVLRIGGGAISADTTLKLYAEGSNGVIDFVDNVTLSGTSAKTIAGNTVSVSDGKVVTVNGGAAAVFTNNANYTGSGGNGSKTGIFGGTGGASTLPFNHPSKPGF